MFCGFGFDAQNITSMITLLAYYNVEINMVLCNTYTTMHQTSDILHRNYKRQTGRDHQRVVSPVNIKQDMSAVVNNKSIQLDHVYHDHDEFN